MASLVFMGRASLPGGDYCFYAAAGHGSHFFLFLTRCFAAPPKRILNMSKLLQSSVCDLYFL